MAEVELQSVSKTYPNGVQAVRGLDLRVVDGELVTILGPSGSGKTTTLRLIAGLEEPTAGVIRIGGRAVNHLAPRERDVAMVFQNHTLYPHLNVRDNLMFGVRLRHRVGWGTRLLWRCFRPTAFAEIRQGEQTLTQRVTALARMLGLEKVLERLPAQLSGGQQQRAALGRALARQPAVFLLDEPLSNLDAPLRAAFRRELHLLQRRFRATMIYVTHDQLEAMTLGDRVLVLDRGRVQQTDPPAVIYERPKNRFVAGFIGSPPMNFADGWLRLEEGSLEFAGDGWSLPLPKEKGAVWAPFAGRPVTLGIRPEDVALSADGAAATALPMEVVVIERLGSDHLVTLQRGAWQVTAKLVRPPAVNTGEKLMAEFHVCRCHLFDRGTGLALKGGDPAG